MLPCLPETSYNIDNSRRETCLYEELPQKKSSDGSLFGWFEDYCASSSQGRCYLPCHHQKWVVPRDYLGYYSNRLFLCVTMEGRTHGKCASLYFIGLSCEVSIDVSSIGNILALRDSVRLAVIEGLKIGKGIGIFLDEISEFE